MTIVWDKYITRMLCYSPFLRIRTINGISKINHYIPRRGLFNLPFFNNENESKNGMNEHKVVRRINASLKQMFEIVSDVSKYQEFVPFVEKSFISKFDPETRLPVEGGLRVGWNHFDEEFKCKLHCIPYQKVVAESLTVLLFDSLYTEWNFKEHKNTYTQQLTCEVELILRYKFKNPLYNSISAMFSDRVTSIMIKAFEQRGLMAKIEKKFKHRQNGPNDINKNNL